MVLLIPCSAWASSVLSTTVHTDTPEEDLGLRLLAPSEDLRGTHATVVVQAFRVQDQSPMPHVPVDIDVHMDDGSDSSRQLGSYVVVTDRRGAASIRFALPRRPAEDMFEITVTAHATWQDIESSVELELWLEETPLEAELSIDRHVYTPGQTVYLRGFWRDEAWLPADGLPVGLTFFGPGNQMLEHLEGQTSALGVAAWSWPIPPTAVPGIYRVQVHGDTKPEDSELIPSLQFEVLEANPDVRLEVHPGQSVALPGARAEIEVRARNADGQPWADAPVDIVEMVIIGKSEADRGARPLRRLPHGDASGQATFAFGAFQPEGSKSTPDSQPLPRTNAEGRLVVTLTDLDIAFQRMDNRGDLYHDLIFEARIQDPETHRTSASRFELRVSPNAIHLHGAGSVGDQRLPDDAYLFAQHADGTPASCWVEVRRQDFHEEHRVVGRVQTNALGVASLEGMALDPYNRYELVALGENPEAPALGTSLISFARQREMRLLTERPLLRIGEDLHMELHLHRPRPHLQAFLWNADGELLAHLDDLKSATSQKLTFPYQDTYQGVLTVLVVDLAAAHEYRDPHDSFESPPSTSRAVVYPGQPGPALDISIHPSPTGNTARLTIDMEEARVPAVAALAATQSSAVLLGRPDDGDSYWENQSPQDLELGSWNLQQLVQLPEAMRYGDAAQLVARGLLGDGYYLTQASQTSHLMPHRRAARRSKASGVSQRAKRSPIDPEPEGRLIGMVADLDGPPLPSIPITVTSGRKKWATVSDEEGFYQLPLPAGKYQVDIEIQTSIIHRHDEVWIVSGRSTYLPALYWPGWTEPVGLGFSSPSQYRAATYSIPPLGTTLRRSGATPRQSTPETHFWLPDALLGADGQLTVDIPLPPGGTRWHLTALASDASGRITTAEREWFVESKP